MKLALTSFIFLFSVSSHACPQVNATFNCANSDGEAFEQTVVSTVADGVTSYRFTNPTEDSVIIADEVLRPYEYPDYYEAYFSVSCWGDMVVVDLKGTYIPSETDPSGEITSKSQITMASDSITTVTYSTWNGEELPTETEECTIKN